MAHVQRACCRLLTRCGRAVCACALRCSTAADVPLRMQPLSASLRSVRLRHVSRTQTSPLHCVPTRAPHSPIPHSGPSFTAPFLLLLPVSFRSRLYRPLHQQPDSLCLNLPSTPVLTLLCAVLAPSSASQSALQTSSPVPLEASSPRASTQESV